ncbi:MAG: hypothetical protein KJ070_25790, partial [Verrucomicrobia bacterium]|nr:hypothetical protein [Verrucomicrobiota bacterium]
MMVLSLAAICGFVRPLQAQPVFIADASWSNIVDNDSDGCASAARLNWNPDVNGSGTVSVFERVFYSTNNGLTWVFMVDLPWHNITGTSTSDTQSLDLFEDG